MGEGEILQGVDALRAEEGLYEKAGRTFASAIHEQVAAAAGRVAEHRVRSVAEDGQAHFIARAERSDRPDARKHQQDSP